MGIYSVEIAVIRKFRELFNVTIEAGSEEDAKMLAIFDIEMGLVKSKTPMQELHKVDTSTEIEVTKICDSINKETIRESSQSNSFLFKRWQRYFGGNSWG